MRHEEPSPETLLQIPHRTLPCLALVRKGTALKIRSSDDFPRLFSLDNWMLEHRDNCTHENTFVGGDARPNEWRRLPKRIMF